MKIIKLISILLLITIISCKKNNVNTKKGSSVDSLSIVNKKTFLNDSLKSIIQQTLVKGDTSYYNKLYREFVIHGHKQDFLYYSMKMGELHNYGQAYFDVSSILIEYNYKNKFPLRDKLYFYFLLKAYEAGNQNAKIFIKEKYTEKGLEIPTSTSILQK